MNLLCESLKLTPDLRDDSDITFASDVELPEDVLRDGGAGVDLAILAHCDHSINSYGKKKKLRFLLK